MMMINDDVQHLTLSQGLILLQGRGLMKRLKIDFLYNSIIILKEFVNYKQ